MADRYQTTITVGADGTGEATLALRHSILHLYLIYDSQPDTCEVSLASVLDDSNDHTHITITGNTDGVWSPTTPTHGSDGAELTPRIPISVYGDLKISVASGAAGAVTAILELI